MLEKFSAFGRSEDFTTNIRGWRRNFELDELIEGTGSAPLVFNYFAIPSQHLNSFPEIPRQTSFQITRYGSPWRVFHFKASDKASDWKCVRNKKGLTLLQVLDFNAE